MVKMNCDKCMKKLGADPTYMDDELQAHVSSCDECAQLRQELLAFNEVLNSAMDVDVPAGLGLPAQEAFEDTDNVVSIASQSPKKQVYVPPAYFAVAATVLMGIGAFFGAWLSGQDGVLQQNLSSHVAHEAYVIEQDLKIIPAAEVQNVLEQGRVSPIGDIGAVRHAKLCRFRGNKVAHLIVQSSSGPIDVMLLPEETIPEATFFEEEGYRGLLVPVGSGSVAILGDDVEALKKFRDRLIGKVAWSI